eukprot:gene1479-1610_t
MRSEVAFIILSDGPCDSSSFRPNDDQSQWWSRRDALVRIVRAACYKDSQHLPASSVHSVQIVFHSEKDRTDHATRSTNKEKHAAYPHSIGLSFIQPVRLARSTVPTLTEQALIRSWKMSFQQTESLRSSNSRSTSDFLSSWIWPLQSHNDPKNNSAAQLIIGKKQMIQAMQLSCDIDFLRKHHLNGSIELVSKKSNKSDVESAYAEFQTIQQTNNNSKSESQTNGGGNEAVLRECFRKAFDNILRTDSIEVDVKDSRKRKRLSQEGQQGTGGAGAVRRAMVLFLHEDYPRELPIFPSTTTTSISQDLQPALVICVLGGVRDTSTQEIALLKEVAAEEDLPCLGANLGRTAEFTSKIVASIVYHASSGRLFTAMQALYANFDSQDDLKDKQVSIRRDGRTWDGHRQVTSITTASNTESLLSSHNPLRQQKQSLFVVSALSCNVEEINPDLTDRERWLPLVHLLVTSLWRSRMASDLTDDNHDAQIEGGIYTTLLLVFQDNRVAVLTQQRVAQEVSRLHSAAPSEYQVLYMVQQLLQDSHVLKNSVSDALQCLISADDTGIDDLYALYLHSEASTNNSASCDQKGRSDLEHLVYGDVCSCCEGKQELSAQHNAVLIVLENARKVIDDSVILSVLYWWKYHEDLSGKSSIDEKRRKRLGKLMKRVYNESLKCSAEGTMVTMLQHWAYHNRLFPSLRKLKK